MNAKDLGVATDDGDQGADAGNNNANNGQDTSKTGQHSDEGQGTGDTTTRGADKGKGEGESAGADDPKDKRINDLMGKWQSEEANHGKTKDELTRYKEVFGELPRDGKRPNFNNDNKGQGNNDKQDDDPDMPEALKPGWNPQTMEDFQEGLRQIAVYGAKQGEKNALGKLESERTSKAEAERQVNDFVTEIKTADPEFDEKAFFAYANKYNFPLSSVADLRSIYRNFVDFNRATASAAKDGAQNRDKRGDDKVNRPGSGSGQAGKIPFKQISNARSARDLVRDALNGS